MELGMLIFKPIVFVLSVALGGFSGLKAMGQPQDARDILPNEIWEYILTFVPADHPFLNQWIRTGKVSQEIINRVVESYVQCHYVAKKEDISKVIKKHFSTCIGTPDQKQKFYKKVRKALGKHTVADCFQHDTFKGMIAGEKARSNPYFDLNYNRALLYVRKWKNTSTQDVVHELQELYRSDSELFSVIKKFVRKDLDCLEKCRSILMRDKYQLNFYINNKNKIDFFNRRARQVNPLIRSTIITAGFALCTLGVGFSLFITPNNSTEFNTKINQAANGFLLGAVFLTVSGLIILSWDLLVYKAYTYVAGMPVNLRTLADRLLRAGDYLVRLEQTISMVEQDLS